LFVKKEVFEWLGTGQKNIEPYIRSVERLETAKIPINILHEKISVLTFESERTHTSIPVPQDFKTSRQSPSEKIL
jgi:hypothetical protein